MVYFKVVLFICMLSDVVKSQTSPEECPCNNPENSITWGEFISRGRCEGSCHGTERGTRSCFAIGADGTIIPSTECFVERDCENTESCIGDWSPWSPIGVCTSKCKQVEARYCYRVNGSILKDLSSFSGGY